MATTNVADRLTAAVQLAFAKVANIGMAEVGPNLPPSKPVVAGLDPRFDRPFINQLFLGSTGGAATSSGDAWLTYGHVGNGGMSFIDSVEQDELLYPLLVHERKLLCDTEGAGRHKGAPSLRVEFEAVGTEMSVTYSADGNIHAPQGACGGMEGGRSRQFVRDTNKQLDPIPASATVILKPGQAIVAVTPGGGGFGDPRERDARLVAQDVLDELLSPERAQAIYGRS